MVTMVSTTGRDAHVTFSISITRWRKMVKLETITAPNPTAVNGFEEEHIGLALRCCRMIYGKISVQYGTVKYSTERETTC